MTTKKTDLSINDSLKQLTEISDWFSQQKELDIETGLEKVKLAAELIKTSKEKLNKLENEFKEIEKDFSGEIDSETSDLIPF